MRHRDAENIRACIIPKGQSLGDRRYAYKNWWCMSASERAEAARRYPHNTPGIPDSAYAYPIDSRGRLAKGRARRTLTWGLRRTMKRTAKARLGGAARRRRRRRR